MRIGDVVVLKPEAVTGRRRELAGEVGKVGDVWRNGEVERCTVVYEAWGCLVWDAPSENFRPAVETRH